jgi:hypothetical protein
MQSLVEKSKEVEKQAAFRSISEPRRPSTSTQNSTPSSDYLFEEQEKHLLAAKKIDTLNQTIFTISTQLEIWKKDSLVDKANEIKSLLKKCRLLDERNTELESISQSIYKDQKNEAIDPAAKIGQRSANLTQTLESRIKDLLDRNREIEGKNGDLQGTISGLEFERKSALQSEQRAVERVDQIAETMKELEVEYQSKIDRGLVF